MLSWSSVSAAKASLRFGSSGNNEIAPHDEICPFCLPCASDIGEKVAWPECLRQPGDLVVGIRLVHGDRLKALIDVNHWVTFDTSIRPAIVYNKGEATVRRTYTAIDQGVDQSTKAPKKIIDAQQIAG